MEGIIRKNNITVIKLLCTTLIILLISIVWYILELFFYGEIQESVVDTIILLIVAPFIYMSLNVTYKEDADKQIITIDTEQVFPKINPTLIEMDILDNNKIISYESTLTETELNKIIQENLDAYFWKNYNNDFLRLLVRKDGEYIGLLNLVRITDTSFEIDRFEIKEEHRNNGYGTSVIKYLKEDFYNNRITGYSTPEAKRFWAKVAADYDTEIYKTIEDSGLLMLFEL